MISLAQWIYFAVLVSIAWMAVAELLSRFDGRGDDFDPDDMEEWAMPRMIPKEELNHWALDSQQTKRSKP